MDLDFWTDIFFFAPPGVPQGWETLDPGPRGG